MMYEFYAIMKETQEEIFLADCSDIELFRRVANFFDGSGHIEKFIIKDTSGNIIEEKTFPKVKQLKRAISPVLK